MNEQRITEIRHEILTHRLFPNTQEMRDILALARFGIKAKTALELAAPFLCSTLCPSTKKDHEEWTHCKSCASVNEALASYPEVKP